MTNNNSGIIATGSVGVDTDPTRRAPGGLHHNADDKRHRQRQQGQLLVHGGVDAALGNNGCVYQRTCRAVQPIQRRRVPWKGYAQDLGALSPSARQVRDREHARGQRHVPAATTACAAIRAPRATTRSPADESHRADRRRHELHRPQPANAGGNGDPADQYVGSTSRSAGSPRSPASRRHPGGVSYPAQQALNEPSTPEYDGRARRPAAAANSNCDGNHITNLDDPATGWPTTWAPRERGPRSTGSRRTTAATPTTRPARAQPVGAFNPTARPTTHRPACRADDPEATTPATTPAGCTPPICSCATTFR